MVKKFGRIAEITKPVKIDAKDSKILALLSEDARMPASDIAKKIFLSRDAVSYRIRKLQEEGVILLFFPIVDFKKFGYYTYQVFLLLDEKVKEKHHELLTFLIEHPNTKSLMTYTDTWDVEWTLIARNLKEFDYFLTDLLSKFPEIVLEKEKLAIIEGYTSIHLPYCYYSAGIHPKTEKQKQREIKCDSTDYALLTELSENSRQSSYELGKKLGISPDTVIYRIRRLVDAQVIRKFSTLINLSHLGHTWYTYAINFKKFDSHDEVKLKEFVSRHPHIIRAVKLFGAWDVLLYIVSDSLQNYHKTVKEIKNTFSDIIYTYQTWLAHEELFFTAIPKVLFSQVD